LPDTRIQPPGRPRPPWAFSGIRLEGYRRKYNGRCTFYLNNTRTRNPDSRFLLKSEYGPFSDDWPVLAFSNPRLGDMLRRQFRTGVDFVLITGTMGRETSEEEHRGRLLSLVSIIQSRQGRLKCSNRFISAVLGDLQPAVSDRGGKDSPTTKCPVLLSAGLGLPRLLSLGCARGSSGMGSRRKLRLADS